MVRATATMGTPKSRESTDDGYRTVLEDSLDGGSLAQFDRRYGRVISGRLALPTGRARTSVSRRQLPALVAAILVFAYVYYMVYRDLYTSEKLVWTGIWGKMASASADLYFLVFKTGVAHIFWITVCTDYIFVITFFLFTRWVRQQKDSPQLRAS